MATGGLTYTQVSEQLAAGKYAPVYLLMGDESYYIDKLTDFFQEKIIAPEAREFCLTVTYGDQVTLADVVNSAKSFPMMGDKQVIIVKEAQNLWSKKKKSKELDEDSLGSEDGDELKSGDDILLWYLKRPLASTILVFCYKNGKMDKRKKLYGEIHKCGVVFESEKLRDYEVGGWIRNYSNSKGWKIDDKAVSMLSESVENDLNRLVGEMEKLDIMCGKKKAMITEDDVERYVGVSKEFNNFELQKALAERDTLKATKIVAFFGKNPKANPIFVTIAFLYGFFFKLLIFHYSSKGNDYELAKRLEVSGSYALKDYVKASQKYNAWKCMQNITFLRRANANAVGLDSNANTSELLEELVFKLMH